MKTFKIVFLVTLISVFFSCERDKYPDLKDGMYAELQTAKGDIVLELFFENVPNTVANFVSLAEGTNQQVAEKYKGKPFYDGLTFHRVVPHFMIQGGDPEGSGMGGTGYKFEDEFPVDKTGNFLYTHDQAGILSMANSGRNTNSSQFFITHNATEQLDGKHSVFGLVKIGLNTVDAIAEGDKINKVTIIRKGDAAKDFDAATIFTAHITAFEKKLKSIAERKKRRVLKSEEVVKKMAAFIAEKKGKAKVFPSGLRMYITQRGAGKRPATGEVIEMDFAGYYETGRLFHTSVLKVAEQFNMYDEQMDQKNGYHPMQMIYSREAGLIPGLKEGMLNLNFGDKAMLFIPAHLAYGAEGNSLIPPNTDVVYEIEIKR